VRIAVAGASGCVGRFVVQAALDAGHTPVAISRTSGVDIVTGGGLDAALEGALAVIDVSNVKTFARARSAAFFEAGTANLLSAGQRAGVRHHVALSVVGIDRVDLGYYAGKRRQEALVLSGAWPCSVLRATQFYEFAAQMVALSRGPAVLVPRMRSQPVAAREVALALVEAAVGHPLGLMPECAGPEPAEMTDLVRRLLAARRVRRRVQGFQLPGRAGTAMAAGALLPTGGGLRGQITFTQWLSGPDGGYLSARSPS